MMLISCVLMMLTACVQPLGTHQPKLPQPAFIFPASTSGTTAAAMKHPRPKGIVQIGNNDAPLTLLLVTNFFCPYCREFAQARLPRLMKDFVAPGKIRISITILDIHKYPRSMEFAAMLACAADQGQGLIMHDFLFDEQHQSSLDIRRLRGVDGKKLAICIKDQNTTALLQKEQSILRDLGITLVPTFFLNGEKFTGLPEYADLRGRVEEALSQP